MLGGCESQVCECIYRDVCVCLSVLIGRGFVGTECEAGCVSVEGGMAGEKERSVREGERERERERERESVRVTQMGR